MDTKLSRFRVKMGLMEIECEGTEEFLKSEVPTLLQTVTELYRSAPVAPSGTDDAEENPSDYSPPSNGIAGTTRALASRLGVKTEAELAQAAAAKLDLVDGLSTFSRKQLLDEMKSATGYYKSTFSNNLSKSLATLVKDDRLREPSSEKYCLSAAAKADLEAKLAG